MNPSQELLELLNRIDARSIVCPMPVAWDKIFRLIKAAKLLEQHPIEKGPEVMLLNPLILGGWGASEKDKSERFRYHLRQADSLGVLPQVTAFLNKLKTEDHLVSSRNHPERTSFPN